MSTESIIRDLMKRGILPTKDAIEAARREGTSSLAEQPAKKTESIQGRLSVTVDVPKTKGKLAPNDFIEYYNKVYETMKDMLLEKTNAVSINKLPKTVSAVSVIGMVKSLTSGGFLLEDPTGDVPVISEKRPMIDDVIAVSGVMREDRIYESDIIYPGIPLSGRGTGSAEIHLSREEDGTHKITVSWGSESETRTIKTTYARITAQKGDEKISAFFFNPGTEIDGVAAKLLLKRRHLFSMDLGISPDEMLILKDAPDVFWISGTESWKEIYKGTIIACTGKDDVVISPKKAEPTLSP